MTASNEVVPESVSETHRPTPTMARIGSSLIGYLAMIVVILVALLPLLLMLRIALTKPADWFAMPVKWTSAPYWQSFSDVLGSTFPHNLTNSLIVSIATTVAVTVLSAMAGHALARMRSRHKERFLFFVLSTRMGPAVIFALPIYLLAVKLSLVDTHLGLIAVYTVTNLAFGIWMMHGFFIEVPPEIEEAGLIDGLSEWGVFWKVSLRLASSGVIATAILVFVFTWNEFFYAFVLTRSEASTFPVTIPGYFGSFQIDWGHMFAASALGVLPPVIFGVLVRKWLARGLSGGLVE